MRRPRDPPYSSVEAGATLSLLHPVPRPALIAGRALPFPLASGAAFAWSWGVYEAFAWGYESGQTLEPIMRRQGTAKVYRIVVRSELGDRYAAAFEGMRMETREGQTILTGEVKDQPHLFGVLERLNGLGLELLSVEVLPKDVTERDLEPRP
jgi:hypothetical protein